MSERHTEHSFYEANGIAIKQIVCQGVGTKIYQHVHEYDHLSLLTNGGVEVWIDGKHDCDAAAPAVLEIKSGVAHEFVTKTYHTVIYCVHNVSAGPIAYELNPNMEEAG